jgi:hypothetical protein
MIAPVPWECLDPGPVGEYLEVVDCDPASSCFYAPVDLNDPMLLAQDGLEPSEGNPKFHQQMAYAVASMTIRNFERALGRRALWAPRKTEAPGGEKQDQYIPHLRIYPHALREANSYYDPEKKALLFGYFSATDPTPGTYLPGGTVFCCLSHDVIAHETTHALLDGVHRRFLEPTNPDVLAYHEAFADLVALFQHFTFPEVLRDQIARTRGDLAGQNLLGQLAQEFGLATGERGALRDALGKVDENGHWKRSEPDPTALAKTYECHARGAILVAAVFDAFVSIYKSRVADLLRIATGGTGVLPAGALHPDLVNRLAVEAAKSAQHVLTMCVRAVDYLPPVDVTFGEYLRALITADHDLVADDDRGYRAAFIDSFRRHGIYPRDVRALSLDSLLWKPPTGEPLWQADVIKSILAPMKDRWTLDGCRHTIYNDAETARAKLHEALKSYIPDACCALGIVPAWANGDTAKFEVHSVRPARRVGPDGQTQFDIIVEITQRCWVDEAGKLYLVEDENSPPSDNLMFFRGGCTLVVDGDTGEIRYTIRKRVDDTRRQALQRSYYSGEVDDPAPMAYGGLGPPALDGQPFAALHRLAQKGGL